MNGAWLAGVSGFALAMAATPGPNNTMVAASGANHGFRRTLPLICGVALGVAVIILAVEAAGSAFLADPHIRLFLKSTGLVYLLWLAWRIGRAPVGRAGEKRGGSEARPLGWMQGVVLQFINPKLWAMVAGAVAAYGGAAEHEEPLGLAAAFALIFGAATFVSTVVWTLLGARAARFIKTERAMLLFNRTMACLLLIFLLPVLAG
jgi:threonine/homoserine/homoserine lactone efflux protein